MPGIGSFVGDDAALGAALLPIYLGYGWLPAVLVVLLAGAVCGLLNGLLVAVVGVQPIVATLALLVGGRGLALVVAGGQSKDILNAPLVAFGSDRVLGLPYTVLLAAALAVTVGFVVRRTTFGRQLLAVGGSPRASALAGLPVRRTLLGVYLASGLLAGVAAVVATVRLTASDPSTVGTLIELSAITAVVVGGTPLSGGKVRVLGTVAGALLMQLLRHAEPARPARLDDPDRAGGGHPGRGGPAAAAGRGVSTTNAPGTAPPSRERQRRPADAEVSASRPSCSVMAPCWSWSRSLRPRPSRPSPPRPTCATSWCRARSSRWSPSG